LGKEEAKKEISKLIAKFEDLNQKGELHTLNETDVSEIFILELFKALGWDTGNKDEVKRQEKTRSSGRVDYSLRLKKSPILLFEIIGSAKEWNPSWHFALAFPVCALVSFVLNS